MRGGLVWRIVSPMTRRFPGPLTSPISLSTALKEGQTNVAVHHEGKHAAPVTKVRPDEAIVKPTAQPKAKTSHTGPRPFRGQARGS
jgi:hypothetical protein